MIAKGVDYEAARWIEVTRPDGRVVKEYVPRLRAAKARGRRHSSREPLYVTPAGITVEHGGRK